MKNQLALTIISFAVLCLASSGISRAAEPPFSLTASREGDSHIKLVFQNGSESPVTIDKETLLGAFPFLSVGEPLGYDPGEGGPKKSPSAFTAERERKLKDPSRAVVIAPRGKYEVTVDVSKTIASASKDYPNLKITLFFYLSKLILSGKADHLSEEELYLFRVPSNGVQVKP